MGGIGHSCMTALNSQSPHQPTARKNKNKKERNKHENVKGRWHTRAHAYTNRLTGREGGGGGKNRLQGAAATRLHPYQTRCLNGIPGAPRPLPHSGWTGAGEARWPSGVRRASHAHHAHREEPPRPCPWPGAPQGGPRPPSRHRPGSVGGQGTLGPGSRTSSCRVRALRTSRGAFEGARQGGPRGVRCPPQGAGPRTHGWRRGPCRPLGSRGGRREGAWGAGVDRSHHHRHPSHACRTP